MLFGKLGDKVEQNQNKMSWEYKIIVLRTGTIWQGKALEEWHVELNKLGQEGWELVSVIPMYAQIGLAGSTPEIRCFLKREKFK